MAPAAYLAKWKNQTLPSISVEPLASEEAERGLKFGDCCSLFSVEHNGYISTDGYVCLSLKLTIHSLPARMESDDVEIQFFR